MSCSRAVFLVVMATAVFSSTTSKTARAEEHAPLLSLNQYLSNYSPYPEPGTLPRSPKHCRLIHINHIGRHTSRHILYQHHFEDDVLIPALELGLLTDDSRSPAPLLERPLKLSDSPEVQTPGKQLGQKILDLKTLYAQNPSLFGKLTEFGKKEVEGIGKRLLSNAYIPTTRARAQIEQHLVIAESTYPSRSQNSRALLMAGIQSTLKLPPPFPHLKVITPNQYERDLTLRPYKVCKLYQSNLPENAHLARQARNGYLSQQYDATNERVYNHFLTNPEKSTVLKLNQLQYKLCQLDAANGYQFDICPLILTHTGIDDLSRLFSRFNNAENLWFDHLRGQAFSIKGLNSRMQINLLNDFLTSVEAAIEKPQASAFLNLRFSHDQTILRFLLILGITDQQPPTRNTLPWNISKLSPMAANLVWQTYACEHPSGQTQYKVRMLLNERSLPFPIAACQKPGELCDWAHIQEHYQKLTSSYSLDELCEGLYSHTNWDKE